MKSLLFRKIREDLRVCTHRAGASGFFSALLFSPGFMLILRHRIASELYSRGILGRLLGRILWRLNIFSFGCHISLKADIGGGLLMPHPVAIVIGDGVIIGDRATIYQSVTIGAASKTRLTYPRIESGVTLYPGCVVVGAIKVGCDVVVGANCFVRQDVPDFAACLKEADRFYSRP